MYPKRVTRLHCQPPQEKLGVGFGEPASCLKWLENSMILTFSLSGSQGTNGQQGGMLGTWPHRFLSKSSNQTAISGLLKVLHGAIRVSHNPFSLATLNSD